MKQLLIVLLVTPALSLAQVKSVTVAELAETGMSIGSFINQKNTASITAFVSGSVFTSLDSGATWTEVRIPNLTERQGISLANDSKGVLYYFFSATTDKGSEGFFSKSTDGGKKWTDPESFGVAPGATSAFALGSHPRKDALMLVWSQIEQGEGSDCGSHIFMATGSGKKWDEPRRLNKEPGNCDNTGGRLVPASPLIGRDGKTFIIWAGKESFHLDRSYDGGDLWINSDIRITDQVGGWMPSIPGVGESAPAFSVAIDNSAYRTVGTLYLVYTDQKAGPTDTDVWFLRSPNQGDNWTYPLRLNKDESGAHQYSPKVTVDNATGFIYAAYFDRRESGDSLATDVYLAYSGDGGASFEEKKVTDVPFTPREGESNLLSVTASKGVIHLLWTMSGGSKTTLRSATIRQDKL